MTIERMNTELDQMLHHRERRKQLFDDYSALRKKVGGPGASQKVANSVIKFLRE
jgi:lipid A disaccharide synthetase